MYVFLFDLFCFKQRSPSCDLQVDTPGAQRTVSMAFPARLFFWAWLLHCNHLRSPISGEFNTTRSSTSSCLVTVTASDLKNSYNLSFINQDSAARSRRISCKIAWVDIFRKSWKEEKMEKLENFFGGVQLLKHRSIPWLSMEPAAASLSETWRDFVVHHFRPGQSTAATGLWRGEAVMPMCKYYVDHNHKVAQGRCDLSNTSPLQACFYMYVSMQWQEY